MNRGATRSDIDKTRVNVRLKPVTPSGISPEFLLQIYQTLLLWIAWIFIGFACLGGLTFVVFLWNEFLRSPSRRRVLPRSIDSFAPHLAPEAARPRFALLPLVRIVLTTHRRRAPLPAAANDERK